MFTFYCAICGCTIAGATGDDWLVECPRCSHVVPVPAQFSGTPEFAEAMRVLAPGVLALEVKFRCEFCAGKLQIDARMEGCPVDCPRCGKKTRIPLWSRIDHSQPVLTPAEIDFLTQALQPLDAPSTSRLPSYASG